MEFPTTKTIKDAIRDAIGQQVTFICEGTYEACPTCSGLGYYDEINQTSLDSTCTVCSGAYWLFTDSKVTAVAHVRWSRMDEPNREMSGKTTDGECYITVSVDSLTPTQVNTIKEIQADSRRLNVYRTVYKGVPTRDRITFVAKEFTKTA